jgi:multicomponent K+:H+ antiporter subunit D
MGLNGALLTADLFNLFVFFEILLAASYGLLLHGSGRERVTSGLHYIAFNLAASLLFLIGVAMLYGITGTLNMADIAHKLPRIPDGDRGLLHAGAAILALAFLGKAALWPLGFWLAPAYTAASAPVAALFVLMTKVGVYAVLRLWTLCFPASAGASALFGADALVWGGLATLAFGAIGVLASQRLGRLAAFSIVVSSGTLLAAIGFAQSALTAGALYYLVASTLGTSAMFLLVELVERARQHADAPLYEVRADGGAFGFPPWRAAGPPLGTNLDDDEEALIGKAMPAAMAFLGMSFIVCALLIAGLPPLTGFVAKFALLSALLMPQGAPLSIAAWTLLALLIGSGLLATIGWSRAGIRVFWAPRDGATPRLRIIECAPIAALLLICAALVVQAEAALAYTRAAAQALHEPARYIDAVLATRARPGPTRDAATPAEARR